MKDFDIEMIMEKLSSEKKVFYSESDFQHSLRDKIKENYPDYEVILEWPVLIGNKHAFIDMVLKKDQKIIPIELKYKTNKLKYNDFDLKHQSANDLACYDYLKDIQRVESLMTNPKFEKGFSIFLTNDLGYLNKPYSNAGYKEFSIYDGRKIYKDTSLNWGESSGEGTRKGREDPITLKFNYHFKWKDYSNLNSNSSNDKFKYLLSEIQKEHSYEETHETQPEIGFLIDGLERLANLYENGFLTDDEFAAMKMKLIEK